MKLHSPALPRALTSLMFWPRWAIGDEVTRLSAIQAGPQSETLTSLRSCQSGAAQLHGLVPNESARNQRRGWKGRGDDRRSGGTSDPLPMLLTQVVVNLDCMIDERI